MTPYQKQQIEGYEEDIKDAEKSVNEAKKELEDAHVWLGKQKLAYAEAIIRLNEYKKNEKLL